MPPRQEEVVHLGRNLLEITGVNGVKYALKVADKLFTPQELRERVLEQSNKTSRPPLSPNRVKKLKTAIANKFQFSPT